MNLSQIEALHYFSSVKGTTYLVTTLQKDGAETTLGSSRALSWRFWWLVLVTNCRYRTYSALSAVVHCVSSKKHFWKCGLRFHGIQPFGLRALYVYNVKEFW
jgi:hypothetical protein